MHDAGKGDRPRPAPNYEANYTKIKRVADWAFRRHIKTLPCMISNDKCCQGVDPHHVKTRGAGGVDKANIVPLCRIHHTELHTIGRITFEDKYRLGDLIVRAGHIWEEYNERNTCIS